MAQFDFHANPNRDSRRFVPNVLDVQSALIDQLGTRLVMPLSRIGLRQVRLPTNLCPVMEVAGEPLVLMPHRSVEVMGAMDAVLSGF
ncbi:MAG: CcdB family protein [Acidovorax sp.]|uniref:CcdB family protein n=1 Tax=Acidovorax sp. TaxID=1872122 RepID=UPI0039E22AED